MALLWQHLFDGDAHLARLGYGLCAVGLCRFQQADCGIKIAPADFDQRHADRAASIVRAQMRQRLKDYIRLGPRLAVKPGTPDVKRQLEEFILLHRAILPFYAKARRPFGHYLYRFTTFEVRENFSRLSGTRRIRRASLQQVSGASLIPVAG